MTSRPPREIALDYATDDVLDYLQKAADILDNLAAHKSSKAEAAIRARGAWMLFLPP